MDVTGFPFNEPPPPRLVRTSTVLVGRTERYLQLLLLLLPHPSVQSLPTRYAPLNSNNEDLFRRVST